MKKNLKNKKAYSIIVIIIIIGFLTVLTTGVFRLVMNELKDNMTIGNYIKSYAGAESSQELALLEIKKHGYESDKEMSDKYNISDLEKLNGQKNNKDVYISYTRDLKTEKIEDGVLGEGEIVLIPLFYSDSEVSYNLKGITNLMINGDGDGDKDNVTWNIIGQDYGISGTGENFTSGSVKKLLGIGEFSFDDNVTIQKFLDDNSSKPLNYLQMVNGGTGDFEYNINVDTGEKFSKPVSKIISSGEAGTYRTNIETVIDFSKMTAFSKYSIFSP